MNPADAFDEPPAYTPPPAQRSKPPPRPPTPRAPVQSHFVADADDVLEQLKAPPAAPIATLNGQRADTPPPLAGAQSDVIRERERERERERDRRPPPAAKAGPAPAPAQPPHNEAADDSVLGTGIQI